MYLNMRFFARERLGMGLLDAHELRHPYYAHSLHTSHGLRWVCNL